jgi:hypothetical protein
MLLAASRSKQRERTRRIEYFWITEQVDNSEAH